MSSLIFRVCILLFSPIPRALDCEFWYFRSLSYQSALIVTDQGRFRLSLNRRAPASAGLACAARAPGWRSPASKPPKGQPLGGLVSYQSALIVTDQGRFRLSLNRRAPASAGLACAARAAGWRSPASKPPRGQTLGGLVSVSKRRERFPRLMERDNPIPMPPAETVLPDMSARGRRRCRNRSGR